MEIPESSPRTAAVQKGHIETDFWGQRVAAGHAVHVRHDRPAPRSGFALGH